MPEIFDEVKGLYKIIPLISFRRTEGVRFDILTTDTIPHVDAVDRVLHDKGALSPGTVGGVKRPWYMHTHQEDYLMVLQGIRSIDIYNPEHAKVENFEVTAQYIKKNGEMFYDGRNI